MLTDDQKAELVKSLFEEDIDGDELVTDYIVLCGTRNMNAGGGAYVMHNGGPVWAIEGLLRRGLKILDNSVDFPDPD
jgi:hypothetical protein